MIILPALLLAGLGLYSLRQDRVLARVEAGEQAGRVVDEVLRSVFPRVLESGFGELGKWDASDLRGISSSTLRGDPLTLLRETGRRTGDVVGLLATACLVDETGVLIYPPPLRGLPLPAPLELDTLTPSQWSAWFACEEMWLSGIPDERRVASLVALEVPERLVAVARLRTALSLMRTRETLAAGVSELRTLQESTVLSEMGIPVRDLARLQLAMLRGDLPESERRAVVEGLCADLLQSPSPVSEAMWDALRPAETDVELRSQIAVKELHEQARELAQVLEGGPALPGPVVFRGEECWIMERNVNGGKWVLAVPVAALREAVDLLQSRISKPAYLGVNVEWNGEKPTSRAPDQVVLAKEKSNLAGVPLEVTAFLADPVGFDAQREVRARQLMALIGTAVFAVLVGFFAAWRAFRRQQQLSEMKTNFVSSVSHELRAPIASVQLMAEELVEGERPTDEKLAKYHRFIGQECRRLSGVIENVLDFARREQGRERFEFELTDLGTLVSDTVQLLRPYAAERGVKIEEERRGEARAMEADGHALQRVLVNLLDNAIKHSPDGSVVVVGLEFEAQRVLLWVEDDGPGIPRSEQERIFEKFYRIGSELRRQTQGVGLGLSIVKHLAEVHGGRVLVHSNVGEGSRFTVELPMRATSSISAKTPDQSQIVP